MGKELIIDERIFLGIENGTKACCGPHTVQIDLTDRCNNSCLCCWVHSPRLNKKEIFPDGEKELPFELVERLIGEVHSLGTKDIMLSGSGEPFMYPRILDVIELIKSNDIYLNIITNGILFDEKIAEKVVKNCVDLITVSVWAGTPSLYKDLHPGKDEATFERIKDNLKKIASYKKSYGSLLPHVKIYNVLCSKNYFDVESMVDFAKDVQADSIEFQLVDIIKDKTDDFALEESHIREILAKLETIKKRRDWVYFGKPQDNIEESKDQHFVSLGKIWTDYKEGFVLNANCVSLICKRGYWLGEDKRILVAGVTTTRGVYPFIFRFKFKNEKCRECEESNYCLESDCISIKLLNILNTGIFLKKVPTKNLENGVYGTDLISRSCYMGWYYARVLTTGDVIPCCKAAEHSLGNINNHLFSEIWNSSAYNEFRIKAKNLAKTNPYFSKINCIKSCDNRGMNLYLSEEYHSYAEEEDVINKIRKGGGVVIWSKDLVDGDFVVSGSVFGKNIAIDGGNKKAYARYVFTAEDNGNFEFHSRYASGESRCVDVHIDKKLAKKKCLGEITGGWTSEFLKWHQEFDIELQKGQHVVEIISSAPIPHIEKFAFIKKK